MFEHSKIEQFPVFKFAGKGINFLLGFQIFWLLKNAFLFKCDKDAFRKASFMLQTAIYEIEP